jgi:hypothetical protein
MCANWPVTIQIMASIGVFLVIRQTRGLRAGHILRAAVCERQVAEDEKRQ